MYNVYMNELNKSTYEALAGEYEEQQTVLADESAEKERMQMRAERMVRYGIRMGFIQRGNTEKSIALALEVAESFSAERIDTLDAKLKEIEEKNIRAKDERRRARRKAQDDLMMMQDMELIHNDPEKVCESDEEDDPYKDVL